MTRSPVDRMTVPVDRVAAMIRELMAAGVSRVKLDESVRRAREEARAQDPELDAAVRLAQRLGGSR